MGLFDIANARLADIEARLTALEGGTVEPPVTPPVSAISNLQSAINAAASGATLIVPAGTYGPVEIAKPLILVAQSGAVIDAAGAQRALTIKASDVQVAGPWTVRGFGFAGIYANGPYKRLAVRGPSVDGGGKAVFGLHFQNDQGVYVEDVTLEDMTLYGFTSSAAYNYPAHGVYLKQVRRLTMRRVDAGRTAGVGTHSGIDLDDVDTGLIEDCVGHHAAVGIAVNHYPSVGCKNLTFRRCSGHDNSKCDAFEYGTNYNIVWESSCTGTLQRG